MLLLLPLHKWLIVNNTLMELDSLGLGWRDSLLTPKIQPCFICSEAGRKGRWRPATGTWLPQGIHSTRGITKQVGAWGSGMHQDSSNLWLLPCCRASCVAAMTAAIFSTSSKSVPALVRLLRSSLASVVTCSGGSVAFCYLCPGRQRDIILRGVDSLRLAAPVGRSYREGNWCFLEGLSTPQL